MKKIITILTVVAFTAVSGFTKTNEVIPSTQKVMHTETDSFIVSGNCGMCKKTIETSVKDTDGVISAAWNVDSKMFTVNYNPHTISLTQIKQKIADSGYDTDTIKAKEATYNGLPGCCQYERK
ncbi:MAG: mercuric ion binding protein [Bacteroidia bacterium]|jgi:mercuric ion binding protein